MSKGLGQNIVIKFTQDLVGEVSGLNPNATWEGTSPNRSTSHSMSNASAFKVTGREYKHVNGELIDKTYSVEIVERHLDHAENTIRLVMHPQSRFNNVEGKIMVQYDMSKGNLQGKGGFIESFSREFMPTDLVPLPDPYVAERLTVTPDALVAFIKVDIRDSYKEEKINVMPNASITFTYTGIINP